MTHRELTISILKIQAYSKLSLVYLDDDNQPFIISSLKIMEEEIHKIQDSCVSNDKIHFYLAK